jgi:hypothetical protein
MIIENTVSSNPVVEINTSKADEFFKNFPKDKIVAYKDYWESVRPKNNDDIFRRYLFAYCSVHTTWQGNVKGYNAIKNFHEWVGSKDMLLEKLHPLKKNLPSIVFYLKQNLIQKLDWTQICIQSLNHRMPPDSLL